MDSPPAPPPGWDDWAQAMTLALDLARLAGELDEAPVGAVVLGQDGSVLGRGGNQPVRACDPTAHAEIVALRGPALTFLNHRFWVVEGVLAEACGSLLSDFFRARRDAKRRAASE